MTKKNEGEREPRPQLTLSCIAVFNAWAPVSYRQAQTCTELKRLYTDMRRRRRVAGYFNLCTFKMKDKQYVGFVLLLGINSRFA